MALIPGASLIYENSNGVIYAWYRDPPHNTIPRWEIGRTCQKYSLSYNDFREMVELTKTNSGFKEQFESLLTMYYLFKEDPIGT